MSTPYREPTDVSDLAEPDRQYPVIVEETRRYVVWVDAEDPSGAVDLFNCDPSDPGRDAMYSFEWESRTPTKWDWCDIARPAVDGGEWPGMLAEDHIRSYGNHLAYLRQQERRTACKAAGHPIPVAGLGPWGWSNYCGTCGDIDPAERTSSDPAAVGGEPKATPEKTSDPGGGS